MRPCILWSSCRCIRQTCLGTLMRANGLGPTILKSFVRLTTFLSATEEMAKVIGHSMAALVVTVSLWLTSWASRRDQPFLLDALLSPSGLYGNAMLLVLSGCCQRAAQAARLQLLILPRPERECCCLSPPSKRLGVERERMDLRTIFLLKRASGRKSSCQTA